LMITEMTMKKRRTVRSRMRSLCMRRLLEKECLKLRQSEKSELARYLLPVFLLPF
jgi:hypothetical protein